MIRDYTYRISGYHGPSDIYGVAHLGFHGIMIRDYTQRIQGYIFLKIYRDVTYLGYYGPTIHRYFCCIWGYPENNFHRTGNKWWTMIHVRDKMKHIVENALEVILSKQQIFLNTRDYAIEAHKCDFLSLMVINGLRNIPTKANTSQGCAK